MKLLGIVIFLLSIFSAHFKIHICNIWVSLLVRYIFKIVLVSGSDFP